MPFYDLLIRDVALGRRVAQTSVRENYGQGRVLGADRALRAGMIDRIETMDALLSRLARQVTRAPGVPAAAFAALPSGQSAVSTRSAPLDSESRKRRLLLAEAQAGGNTMPRTRDLTDLERRRRRLAAAAR